MAYFEVKTSVDPDRVVVVLAGECDFATCGELTSALLSALSSAQVVVVDVGGLTFLDSSGINSLVTAHHAAQRADARLYLVNASGVVATVLDITGVGDLLGPPADGIQSAGDSDHV